MSTDAEIEKRIQELGLNAPRLNPGMIEDTIVNEAYIHLPGTTTMICYLTLRNGYVVTGKSAAASPENFNEEIGRKVAYDNAKREIWPLEGYLLKTRLSGIERIARVAHEINRAYCAAMGDDTQPPWENAPEWQKESARNGVKMHLANPQATPEDSHVSWFKEKQDAGWKHGPVKDPAKKEHPCMVAYDELPVEQRAKDYLFRAVVHSLI